jgi:hypothetical protein
MRAKEWRALIMEKNHVYLLNLEEIGELAEYLSKLDLGSVSIDDFLELYRMGKNYSMSQELKLQT